MTFKIIILFLFLYLLFRFVMRFVLPILRVTSMAQTSMKEMRKKMEQMQQRHTPPPQTKKEKKNLEGDYIEYEEVK